MLVLRSSRDELAASNCVGSLKAPRLEPPHATVTSPRSLARSRSRGPQDMHFSHAYTLGCYRAELLARQPVARRMLDILPQGKR